MVAGVAIAVFVSRRKRPKNICQSTGSATIPGKEHAFVESYYFCASFAIRAYLNILVARSIPTADCHQRVKKRYGNAASNLFVVAVMWLLLQVSYGYSLSGIASYKQD